MPTDRDTLNRISLALLNAIAMGQVGPSMKILAAGEELIEIVFQSAGSCIDSANLKAASEVVVAVRADALVMGDLFHVSVQPDAAGEFFDLDGAESAVTVGVASEADFSGWFATDSTGFFERSAAGPGRPRADLSDRWQEYRAHYGLGSPLDVIGALMGGALGQAANVRSRPPEYARMVAEVLGLLRSGARVRVNGALTDGARADPEAATLLANANRE